VDFAKASGSLGPATAPTYRVAVYGTKGAVELATPDVEFRFAPVTEPPATSRHQEPPPEIVEYKRIHHSEPEEGGFSNAIPLRSPVMTYCVSAILIV
jgi:hypothetical protein